MITEIENSFKEPSPRHNFEMHAILIQGLKTQMRHASQWENIRYDKREALEMIMRNVGHILNSDSNCKEHWTDITRYAQLIADTLDHDS